MYKRGSTKILVISIIILLLVIGGVIFFVVKDKHKWNNYPINSEQQESKQGDSLDYQCGTRNIDGTNFNYPGCLTSYNCVDNLCIARDDLSCDDVECNDGEYCSHGVCLLQVSGETYFVALWGNDSNNGTFEQPFYSWQKGAEFAEPGDIVYIRGGVWYPREYIGYYSTIGIIIEPNEHNTYAGVSGTKESPIRYYNYPGEKPIVDGSFIEPTTYGWLGGISIHYAEYIYLRGLTVRHIHQNPPDWSRKQKPYSEVGGIGSSGANIHYENMVSHDIDGRGFQHWSYAWNDFDGEDAMFESDNTTWINCDAYNLYDRYSESPGNAADGWKVHGYYGNSFYWEGCRAFNYSDDGFDPSGQAYRHFNNCWAMASNKYENIDEEWKIEGNGYKLTGMGFDYTPNYIPNEKNFVKIENSIAADCTGSGGGVGFYNNIGVHRGGGYPNGARLINNFAYKNGIGYSDSNGSTYNNNIVYDSRDIDPIGWKYELSTYLAWYNESNNSWIYNDPSPGSIPWWYYNPAFNVTDEDFESLDMAELMKIRKADGSLPDISFGHLSKESDLIDRGKIIEGYHCVTAGEHPDEDCVEWYGLSPDLGPFESNY